MQVERLHGPYSCDACHRPSPLGWVYLCTQDFRPEATTDIASPVDSFMDSSSPAVNMDELRALEMSKSITTQIQAGGYTPEQIEIIKAQKVHVHKVLAETVLAGESSNVSDMASPNPAEAEEQAKDEEEVEEPSVSEDDDAVDKITRLVSVARLSTSPICTFKTCHSCRPYFRDRLFTSIEAVLNGEERSIDEFEMRSLHTMRADITRGIGLKDTHVVRPTSKRFPLSDSMESLVQTPLATEVPKAPPSTPEKAMDTAEHVTPSTCSSASDSSANSDISAMEDGDHASSDTGSETHIPTPRISITPSPTIQHRKLRRVSGSVSSSPRTFSDTSSIALSTPLTKYTPSLQCEVSQDDADMAYVTDRKGRSLVAATQKSQYLGLGIACSGSRNSSTSSLGSEVEVDGGVALTEEAVSQHTPDLIT